MPDDVAAAQYQRQARAGLELLAKRLATLSENASKIGAKDVAEQLSGDHARLRSIIDSGPQPEPQVANANQRDLLRRGFMLLTVNLKAAVPIVTAIGRGDLATAFDDEATAITGPEGVLVKLMEQTTLSLEGSSRRTGRG